MTTDPQPLLRQALRSLAEVPAPVDPGTAALRRSGRIRRHRAWATGVSTMVAVAVTVVGVRVGLPAGGTADQAAGLPAARFAVSGYAVPGPGNTVLSQLLDPRTGRYVPSPAGFAVPSPDGRRVLLSTGRRDGARVIDRDALLAGRLDQAWSFRVPDGSCQQAWTPDSRAVVCLRPPLGGRQRLVLADVPSRSLRQVTLLAPAPTIGRPVVISPRGDIVAVTADGARAGTLGVAIVIYSPNGRLLRTLPLRSPGGNRDPFQTPPLDASPDGRLLLLRDGRAVDLRTGVLVGRSRVADTNPPSPALQPLGWYDNRSYLRLDQAPGDPPTKVLRIVDVRTGAILRSVAHRAEGYWGAVTVAPVDALRPNPGPFVI